MVAEATRRRPWEMTSGSGDGIPHRAMTFGAGCSGYSGLDTAASWRLMLKLRGVAHLRQ
jgi:hypothetical protein